MDSPTESPRKQPIKPVGKLIQLGMLLGAFPIFPQMFGFQFLPSADWALKASVPSYVVGVLFGLLLLHNLRGRIDDISGNDLKKVCLVLGTPVMGFLLGKNLIPIAAPMILAITAGHNVELRYVVEDASRFGSRGCRSEVLLQGLPFLFDKLCGIESDLKLALKRDSEIAVTGRGTGYGTFVGSLRQVD